MTYIDSSLKAHGYRLGSFVGKGATADCFVVQSYQFPDKQFVCKVIDPLPVEARKSIFKAVQNEVNILAHLDHPNIIRCYDFFEENGMIFLILEYCQNGQLTKDIFRYHSVDNIRLYNFAIQITEALTYIHLRDIAHLDIKPANIFLSEYNKIKLSDFGCSVHISHGQTISNHVGSKFFRAPETFDGVYDPFKADMFSLGVTFMCMAKREFYLKIAHFEDYLSIIQSESQDLGEFGKIIRECINMDPSKRPDPFEVLTRLKLLTEFKPEKSSRSCGSFQRRMFPKFSLPKIVIPNSKNKITMKPENVKLIKTMSTPLVNNDIL